MEELLRQEAEDRRRMDLEDRCDAWGHIGKRGTACACGADWCPVCDDWTAPKRVTTPVRKMEWR